MFEVGHVPGWDIWEDNERRELTGEQARQGVILGEMRYVLAISTVLTILAFVFICLGYS